MSSPIRFQAPLLPSQSAVGAYFAFAEHDRWFSNNGPCQRLLVERIEGFLGQGVTAVPVNNATIGLMVALRSVIPLDSPRRCVIMPSFTFIATLNAVQWVGCEPVFCDVSSDGWHLDAQSLSDALGRYGNDVAAVLACSTFGTAPSSSQRSDWEELCRNAQVPLVVDTAAGFGSLNADGSPLGTQGDLEVFSFHATKPFAIGEGGLVTTTRPALADRVRRLINFDFDDQRQATTAWGLNGKLSELHAACALAVLDTYADTLAHRRRAACLLRDHLTPAGFMFQTESASSTFQFVAALLPDSLDQASVITNAARQGVELRAYFSPALHEMPAAINAKRCGTLATTEMLSQRIVSLPMSNDLSDADIERIVEVVLGGL